MIKKIGQLDGNDILEATLECGSSTVSILNYGCVVRDWVVAVGSQPRSIVLGFDQFEDYPAYSPSFGIIAGRVANRTSLGKFQFEGQEFQLDCNDGQHHLHGGPKGLGKTVWQLEETTGKEEIQLRHTSLDGDQGYPGEVAFNVRYSLDEHGLHCEMTASSNVPTPVNLAQHNYYNLDGDGSISTHQLRIEADHYLPVDDQLIPTGEFIAVEDTDYDFRRSIAIGERDSQCRGYDHNFVLRQGRDPRQVAASLASSNGDLALDIVTDQPGIQLYTSAKMKVPVNGLGGRTYGAFSGVCLEAQNYPNALNHPDSPYYDQLFCRPDRDYRQLLHLLLTVNQ